MTADYLDIADEVIRSLELGRPVVALESTIISHGMPYPQNIDTARQIEAIVRQHGAVPATIGIIKGRLKVGLADSELVYLGKADSVFKVSRRDLPYIIAKRLDGATTVAATMVIAHLAGISVFATGGIGGVHRDASETFDISADLMELARSRVAVICAGVKSILDIGRTLEYLETQGVPVFGYQTDQFPAFYTRDSGFAVDCRFDTLDELALALKAKWELALEGGVVIGNPVPIEHEMDNEVINTAIEQALQQAKREKISGKRITPYLLSTLLDLTGSKSLDTNIALVLHNAKVGAQLASKLTDMIR